MTRPSNRDRILDALQELIVEIGAGNVALDAIALRAGVSKGGLLYHFPSKSDLFAALAVRLAASIDQMIVDAPTEPVALIRWYLTATSDNADAENTLWRSLLSAIHSVDDEFSAALTLLFTRYSTPLQILQPELAEHVRLVGDGLYLNSLIGNTPPAPELLERIVEDLVAKVLPASDISSSGC